VNSVWWTEVVLGGVRLEPRVHHRLCGIPALLPVRLEVRLFGFLPVSTTSYDLVDEVRINDYFKAFFWPLSWVWMFNRLVGSFVVVRRGAVVLVISPAKPQEFARELSIRVQEWTGQWPLVS
jgi:hypothetical protein